MAYDTIVCEIIDNFRERADKGKIKYNQDMDRTDLSIEEWIGNSIEELMDAILYLKKVQRNIRQLRAIIH